MPLVLVSPGMMRSLPCTRVSSGEVVTACVLCPPLKGGDGICILLSSANFVSEVTVVVCHP